MKQMKRFEDTPIPIWTTMGDAPWLDGKRFPSPRVQEWDVLVRTVKTLKNRIGLKMNTHAHTIEQILEIQCISDSIIHCLHCILIHFGCATFMMQKQLLTPPMFKIKNWSGKQDEVSQSFWDNFSEVEDQTPWLKVADPMSATQRWGQLAA